MDYKRTDAMLMEILRERKTITRFLETVFGFLKRNTDFYHIKKCNADKLGLPKGLKEQILFAMMQRFEPDCSINRFAIDDDFACVPPAVQEVEIQTDSVVHQECQEGNGILLESTLPTTKPNNHDSKPLEKVAFIDSDYKNGACFEKYCWSQSLADVEIQVLLPEDLRSSKSICINILAEQISVRDKQDPTVVVVEGELSNKCKQDFIWTIAEDKLLISLEKLKEMWWHKLFTSEPEIDVHKIDSECYIDELPEASQLAIEKLRVEQLEQDKPASQTSTQAENETLERLREAWNVEGSPFIGQPFDPGMVKFN